MSTMEWKSDLFEQGFAQGFVQGKRENVLKALDVLGLQPTEEQRARVNASTDLAQLALWLERSLTASKAHEVFE
jgi:hypothetical protein